MKYSFNFASEEATRKLAAILSEHLRLGDCLLLKGPVGAGKSFFARSVIQTMLAKTDAVEDVPSPTFTLIQTYETVMGEVWHADLYRLSSLDEIAELGLEDAFDTAITLIEWPEKLGPYTPQRNLELEFSIPDVDHDGRELQITTNGDDWGWLEKLNFY